MRESDKRFMKNIDRKSEGNRLLRISRPRREDNIEADLNTRDYKLN
jgi:hypothetical protein